MRVGFGVTARKLEPVLAGTVGKLLKRDRPGAREFSEAACSASHGSRCARSSIGPAGSAVMGKYAPDRRAGVSGL